MKVLIYGDTTPKSSLRNIADDLVIYLSKYDFTVDMIKHNMTIDDVLSYDIIISTPEIYFRFNFQNASEAQRKELNEKCIPIFYSHPFTSFSIFKHSFIHGIWTTALGYVNHGIGKQIDSFIEKYEKAYLPIGINLNKFYPTKKISKIKKVGFVGNVDNINNTNREVQAWVSNKRPQMFIDIAEGVGLEWVSISNREHNVHMYDDVDLVICTSIEEGGPFSFLESVACKIPFISTRCGLVNEYQNIKTFDTVEEAIEIINELNSSEEKLEKYINDIHYEVFPERDWDNLITKYWLPFIIKKINNLSHKT